ncbi:MAG: hypothetical protein OEN23_21600, partial [Paracoccaceae bacterium]|nr:hypothetical protein [Paracoccaceae bacterium]
FHICLRTLMKEASKLGIWNSATQVSGDWFFNLKPRRDVDPKRVLGIARRVVARSIGTEQGCG